MIDGKKVCFVIQGFGKRTDYRTGRTLDLDASYEVIKEAVENAGLKCVRADEIQHSEVIDRPMYEHILDSDLVIADLSTSNVNAAYELGVRHALRDRPTIIVAEKDWDFPFDVNRNLIRTYEHLGSDIGRREAQRFSTELTEAIRAILARERVDSPLYTYLPDLLPPRKNDRGTTRGTVPKAPTALSADGPSVKVLTDGAKEAMAADDFATARTLLEKAHELRPNEANLIQKLVLAIYKNAQPTEEAALREAHDVLLAKLEPETSNDPETIGLWAAVHKRLWSYTRDAAHLHQCIDALERGFKLKHDYYNGINLAFLLNLRASLPEAPPAEAITDFVQAERVRRKVVEICEQLLGETIEDPHQEFWIQATLWEAHLGLGNVASAETWAASSLSLAARERLPDWMTESSRVQVEQLRELLASSPLSRLDG